MNTVKTYRAVNAENEKIQFGISKIEEIYTKRNGRSDEPHRHDYFTVLLIDKAKGEHNIDFNTYELNPCQIYFVSPGQVHQVVEEAAGKGYVMTFSTAFLIKNSIDTSFIESLNLFQDYGHSPPLKPSASQFKRLTQYADEMFQLHKSNVNMKELSIGSFLKLFLIECNNLCAVNPIESNADRSENSVIREFKSWVDRAYRSEHSSSFYAGKLNMTPDHLNRIIKKAIGRSAKEYIQSRITTEAKRLLYFSKLSNKEIGYQLGFSEPANFSAFFKKCTGLSPSNFKKNELSL